MAATRKRIMFFGDSYTWGWIPSVKNALVERYPSDKRWTGLVASDLGEAYECIEEGLSGRMTAFDDPADPRMNGSKYLPSALASHLPLDLIVIMLGTNDCKAYMLKSPIEIAVGMATLLEQVAQSAGGVSTTYPAPRVLLMAPPIVQNMPNQWFASVFEGGPEKTAELAVLYRQLADYADIPFINSGDHVTADGIDGVHLSEANNAKLASVAADEIRGIV